MSNYLSYLKSAYIHKIFVFFQVGKTYSVYSVSGTLLTTLFGGSIENAFQVVLQVISMGFLRIIMVGILLSFNNIVRNGLKKKNEVKTK